VNTWPRNCARCRREIWSSQRRDVPTRNRHNGRGLCQPCYQFLSRAGELHAYPLKQAEAGAVVEAWARMERAGLSRKQAARRLGMRTNTLNAALFRERKRAA
jgi:hypothetical protein